MAPDLKTQMRRRTDPRCERGCAAAAALRGNRGSQTSEPLAGMGDGDGRRCCEGPSFECPAQSLSFAHNRLLAMQMAMLAVDGLRLCSSVVCTTPSKHIFFKKNF
jgi:hypothetical protein